MRTETSEERCGGAGCLEENSSNCEGTWNGGGNLERGNKNLAERKERMSDEHHLLFIATGLHWCAVEGKGNSAQISTLLMQISALLLQKSDVGAGAGVRVSA
jgi:hypothetical protein